MWVIPLRALKLLCLIRRATTVACLSLFLPKQSVVIPCAPLPVGIARLPRVIALVLRQNYYGGGDAPVQAVATVATNMLLM